MEESEAPRSFAGAKRTILLELKRAPTSTLGELARAAHLSKSATLVHLQQLEARGFVGRSYRRGAVGRPAVCFTLSEEAAKLFPQSYAEMSRWALGFIERRLGRPAVVELLQDRAHELSDRHFAEIDAPTLGRRVENLATVRSEGGYMAEVGGRRQGAIELREHNCPILALVGAYPEACEVERRMFESLLRARVEVSHRVVAGDPVCRFWIREKEGPR